MKVAKLLGAVGALVLLACTPVRADEPAQSWSGLYIGAHVGYGWGDSDGSLTFYDPEKVNEKITDHFPDGTHKRTLSPDGWLGGGQLGMNFQRDSFVYGIELDLSKAGIEDSGINTSTQFGDWGSVSKHITTEIEWLGTVRGRLGFTTGQMLIYGTGGFAWAKTSARQDVFHNKGEDTNLHASGSDKETLAGWTIGGGLEVALSSRLTLKGEYLYIDLGDVSYNFKGTHTGKPDAEKAGKPHTTDGYDADVTLHTFRIGVNYRFGG